MRGWGAVLALYVLSSRQSDSRQSHYKNVNSLSSAGLDIILSHPSGHTRGTVANYELNTEEKTHLFHYLTEISTRVSNAVLSSTSVNPCHDWGLFRCDSISSNGPFCQSVMHIS